MIPGWFNRGETVPTVVICNVCGHAEHNPYCYEARGHDALLADDDYFDALYTTEPTEDVAA